MVAALVASSHFPSPRGRASVSARRFSITRVPRADFRPGRGVQSNWCVWLRMRGLTTLFQILAQPTLPTPGAEGALTSVCPNYQTLVLATTATVAAALGFSRQYRYAFFIQHCLAKHVRRYLLILDAGLLTLRIRGAVPRFKLL